MRENKVKTNEFYIYGSIEAILDRINRESQHKLYISEIVSLKWEYTRQKEVWGNWNIGGI